MSSGRRARDRWLHVRRKWRANDDRARRRVEAVERIVAIWVTVCVGHSGRELDAGRSVRDARGRNTGRGGGGDGVDWNTEYARGQYTAGRGWDELVMVCDSNGPIGCETIRGSGGVHLRRGRAARLARLTPLRL
jgi:hypothetical protein